MRMRTILAYVTNSVHYPTWISKEWHTTYTQSFLEKGSLQDQSNKTRWHKIFDVNASRIWSIQATMLKRKLIEGVKQQLKD